MVNHRRHRGTAYDAALDSLAAKVGVDEGKTFIHLVEACPRQYASG
jgi:hypothetical protein